MYRFLTREWEKLSVSVCDCCSIQRCLKQQRRPSQASTDWQVELPGVLVLHVGGGRSSGRRSQTRGSSAGGKTKTQRQQKNVNRNVVAKTKNRLNLQESQLKLNCESGITLYIKKEKKKENNLALSPLVVFSLCFNLWSGLRNQICCRCFIFSVHVNCLAKKKNRQKKP